MKLSTREEVWHAFEQHLEETYKRDRNFREYWDGDSEWDEDELDLRDEPTLEVMVDQHDDGGVTIRQELTNEWAEEGFGDHVRLEWLRKQSEVIETKLRIQLENEIRQSLRVSGGTLDVIWEYRLNPEQVSRVHELLDTSTFDDLRSRVWQLLPDGSDASDVSQEFHRSLLLLGIVPRILAEDDSFEMHGRNLYGDDTFDALNDEQLAVLDCQ